MILLFIFGTPFLKNASIFKSFASAPSPTIFNLFSLAFPFGESGFCEKGEQKTREVLPVKNFACSSVLCVVDLYRLGFASLPEPLSPKGKARFLDLSNEKFNRCKFSFYFTPQSLNHIKGAKKVITDFISFSYHLSCNVFSFLRSHST